MPNIKKKIKLLRNYGSQKKYVHEVLGYNSRLDEIQACFLRIKLRHLEKWNQRRNEIAKFYLSALKKFPGLILPEINTRAYPVWHQFVIRSDKRDQLLSHFQKNNIDCLVHYPIPPHLSPVYKKNCINEKLAITEQICREIISLPIYPQMSGAEIDYIIRVAGEFFNEY